MGFKLLPDKWQYERERAATRQNYTRLRGRFWFQALIFIGRTIRNFIFSWLIGVLLKVGGYIVISIGYVISSFMQQTPNPAPFSVDYLVLFFWQSFSGPAILEDSSIVIWLPMILVFGFLEIRALIRWWGWHQLYTPNTQTTARFATLAEIDAVYKLIPDRNKFYKGSPGQPMAHISSLSGAFLLIHPLLWVKQVVKAALWLDRENFPGWYANIVRPRLMRKFPKAFENQKTVKGGFRGYYFIDSKPTHGKTTGATRSGKDQMRGYILIDIIRRALQPWNIVDTDAKNEDAKMSFRALREAGFDVLMVNIDDVDWSESFNPFQIAIDYMQDGDIDSAKDEVAKIVQVVGNGSGEQQDEVWDQAAQSTQQSIILILLWLAREHDDPSIATPAGVPAFINSVNAYSDKDSDGLTKFYEMLRKLNEMSKAEGKGIDPLVNEILMTAGSFLGSSGETKTSLMFTLQNRISLYSSETIARLTSESTIRVMDVGFPRMVKLHFTPEFAGLTAVFELYDWDKSNPSAAHVFFYRLRDNWKHPLHMVRKWNSLAKPIGLIESDHLKVSRTGTIQYPVQALFPENWRIKVHFNEANNPRHFKDSAVEITGVKREKRKIGGALRLDPYSKKPIIRNVVQKQENHLWNGAKATLDLRYSEKPMAVFLITPQDNDNYAALASLFVSQVFSTTTSLATKMTRKKLPAPILYKLNEFSMFPRIPGFNNLLTRGLTYGHIVDMYLQNMSQLENHYSKNEAKEIDGNMMNWWHIQTPEQETNQLLSDQLGKVEVVTESVNSQVGHDRQDKGNRQATIQSRPLLDTKELAELSLNEMVVIRLAARNDKHGRRVRPWPIFDTEDMLMPNARDLIGNEFSLDYYTTDLRLKNKNAHLEYEDLFKDFQTFYEELAEEVGADAQNNSGNSPLVSTLTEEQMYQKLREMDEQSNIDRPVYDQEEQAAFDQWQTEYEKHLDDPILDEAQLADAAFVDMFYSTLAGLLKQTYYAHRSAEVVRILNSLLPNVANPWLEGAPEENNWAFLDKLLNHNMHKLWSLEKTIRQYGPHSESDDDLAETETEPSHGGSLGETYFSDSSNEYSNESEPDYGDDNSEGTSENNFKIDITKGTGMFG